MLMPLSAARRAWSLLGEVSVITGVRYLHDSAAEGNVFFLQKKRGVFQNVDTSCASDFGSTVPQVDEAHIGMQSV